MHLIYLVVIELHCKAFSCSMLRGLKNFNSLTFSLETRIDNPDFERIEQNIRHFLRSEQLSKVRVMMNIHAHSKILIFNFALCFQILVGNIFPIKSLPRSRKVTLALILDFPFQGYFGKLTHNYYRQEPNVHTFIVGGGCRAH